MYSTEQAGSMRRAVNGSHFKPLLQRPLVWYTCHFV